MAGQLAVRLRKRSMRHPSLWRRQHSGMVPMFRPSIWNSNLMVLRRSCAFKEFEDERIETKYDDVAVWNIS